MKTEIDNEIAMLEQGWDAVGLMRLLAGSEALGSSGVRRGIAKALGRIGDFRAVDALSNLLVTDESDVVRLSALRALEGLPGEEGTVAIQRSIKEQTSEGLLVLSIESLSRNTLPTGIENEFFPLLDNEHGSVRAAAARAIGRSKDPRSPEVLLRLFSDKRRDVRVAALKAMIEIGDSRFTSEMLQTANKEPWPLRWILRRAIRDMNRTSGS